jgi:hypothetical protein
MTNFFATLVSNLKRRPTQLFCLVLVCMGALVLFTTWKYRQTSRALSSSLKAYWVDIETSTEALRVGCYLVGDGEISPQLVIPSELPDFWRTPHQENGGHVSIAFSVHAGKIAILEQLGNSLDEYYVDFWDLNTLGRCGSHRISHGSQPIATQYQRNVALLLKKTHEFQSKPVVRKMGSTSDFRRSGRE